MATKKPDDIQTEDPPIVKIGVGETLTGTFVSLDPKFQGNPKYGVKPAIVLAREGNAADHVLLILGPDILRKKVAALKPQRGESIIIKRGVDKKGQFNTYQQFGVVAPERAVEDVVDDWSAVAPKQQRDDEEPFDDDDGFPHRPE